MCRIYYCCFVLAIGVLNSNVLSQVTEFESAAGRWLNATRSDIRFAFDEFFPGIDGRGDLSGPTAQIDLGSVQVTFRVFDGSGAIHDESSIFGWVSDCILPHDGVGAEWKFSKPIFGLQTFYGSLASTSHPVMTLYSGDNVIAALRWDGVGPGVDAVGHGFISDVPIDRVVFNRDDRDVVLIGAFIGVSGQEKGLGVVQIPGYHGPNGDKVEYDVGLTLEPPRTPLILEVANLVGGEQAAFSVTGATPGEVVAILWSNKRGAYILFGSNWCVNFGIDIPIQNPIIRLIASGSTDQQGVFRTERSIPILLQGRKFFFQAAEKNTCPDNHMSNIWQGVVQ